MRRIAMLVLLVLTGCAGSIAHLNVQSGVVPIPCCTAGDKPVEFEYLGSGGWMVRRGDDAVMTAPFFTNPRLWGLVLPMRPARPLILGQMRTVAGRENVRVVLAGHAHYDHLLDIATVLEELHPDARVYGGTTVAAVVPPGRGEDVVAKAGTMRARGEWITHGRVRFLPIFSEHAAHLFGIKAMNGHYAGPPAKPPRYAWQWKEGETLAFLIDLLNDDGSIAFRIYYDDSAHNSPYGYVDEATKREHPIDVAILCVASYREVTGYPRNLVDWLQPKHVLLGHWEDFFLPYTHAERTVRMTNVPGFLAELPAGTKWTMMKRRGIARFTP